MSSYQIVLGAVHFVGIFGYPPSDIQILMFFLSMVLNVIAGENCLSLQVMYMRIVYVLHLVVLEDSQLTSSDTSPYRIDPYRHPCWFNFGVTPLHVQP